jgi:hypothetical protein
MAARSVLRDLLRHGAAICLLYEALGPMSASSCEEASSRRPASWDEGKGQAGVVRALPAVPRTAVQTALAQHSQGAHVKHRRSARLWCSRVRLLPLQRACHEHTAPCAGYTHVLLRPVVVLLVTMAGTSLFRVITTSSFDRMHSYY